MNYSESPVRECLTSPGTGSSREERITEAFASFYEAFSPKDARDILTKWMEVAMCCHDTLYDDWQERSAAYWLCRNLQSLLEAAALVYGKETGEREYPIFMDSSLHYLNRKERELLDQITRCILAAAQPENIYCYGSRHYRASFRGCLNILDYDRRENYAFDLLLITGNSEKRPEHELQEIVECRCRALASLNALVHSPQSVRAGLESGNLFFNTVFREGIQLYSQGIIRFPEPGYFLDPAEIRNSAISAWETWSSRAKSFMQGVEFYLANGDCRIAVFMLHQAAEHTCTGIILALTGYRITTHNLDKLLRFTNLFTDELSALFPRNTREEIRLFLQLQKAYTHSRYRDNYQIGEAELESLTLRIRMLQQSAEKLYSRFFNGLPPDMGLQEENIRQDCP